MSGEEGSGEGMDIRNAQLEQTWRRPHGPQSHELRFGDGVVSSVVELAHSPDPIPNSSGNNEGNKTPWSSGSQLGCHGTLVRLEWSAGAPQAFEGR